MAVAFIDTNVLVYANDDADVTKRDRAMDVIASLARRGDGAISTQCLIEYGAVAYRKLGQPVELIDAQLEFFTGCFEVVPVSAALIGAAVRLAQRFRIHYFDALILAAAASAGCGVLYSEDLNPGQSYSDVRVVDPFRT